MVAVTAFANLAFFAVENVYAGRLCELCARKGLNFKNIYITNFEKYVISRMGKTLYELYVKNYNIKQWKIKNLLCVETALQRALAVMI